MIPKSFIASLVILFALLILSFGVLMGGYGLAAGMGDTSGARLLWAAAMVAALLLTIVSLTLVGTLGLIQVLDSDEPHDRPRRRRRQRQE